MDTCEPGTPSAEVCDSIDNDCDGSTDEGLGSTSTTCGVGACGSTGDLICQGGAWVDTCAPGTPSDEVCDGEDNDCDGILPDDETDADGDGYMICANDCDDENGDIHPGAPETGNDGIDSNCNGQDNCFIATAAFGSLIEPRVVVLREFRDRHLMTSEAGRRFVELYYTYSPPVAEYIAEKGWLKALVRTLLLPVIGIVSLIL